MVTGVRRWLPWLLLLVQALLALRSWWHYRSWPRLEALPESSDGAPLSPLPVAIVIPARDEAENLLLLLPSLLCLEPPPAEIVLVDDRSHDATAAVGRGFGIRVVQTSEPPAGWSGKNWACVVGAAQTTAPWLLFADADTWQAPGSLGAACACAEREAADLLSVFPQQECRTLWERLLLPFAFAQYLAAVNPRWAADDRASSALANGQYLLVRRALYDRVGRHAAVRTSLGEDVALARLARRAGGRVRVFRAESLVRVRMYRSLAGLQTGFRKFMVGYLLAEPVHGVQIVAATALAGLPLIRLVEWRLGRGSGRLAAASWVVGVAGAWPWARWFNAGWWTVVAQPLAYALFQVVALDSLVRWLLGIRVRWKDRDYPV
ncbi:MAG: glycosyltransferase [Chloroflexi bacterium]|nr:glycosyltransferase [Chloroflexota bacterium]